MGKFDGRARIGIDESGKGDYFGPLVIAAVMVDETTEKVLEEAGVKDSKKLSDPTVLRLSSVIANSCKHSVVRIGPGKYNELYAKINNLNKMLAWGHARSLENVLANDGYCDLAISDQFGDERFLKQALMKAGREVELIQMPKAEQDVAVAAASIMARAGFVKAMKALSEEAGMTLPKGSSDPRVLETVVMIVGKGGLEALSHFAKLHFKTTRQVLGTTPSEGSEVGR